MSLFQSTLHDIRLPVFVLSGFLGSGKTTLLNRLLRDPAWADTAVIVNELGDVALDHLLVERIDGEVAVLRSGCVCCAVRSDFEETLRELLAKRDEGSIPAFNRVVVETTGLADPAPLLQSVETNPMLATFCRLGAVITTVDVVNGDHQLASQWEARKQVVLADQLLLTKTDLAPLPPALATRLDALNPHAPREPVGEVSLATLLTPRARDRDLHRAVGLLAGRPLGPVHDDVRSVVVESEAPLDWLRLQAWLADLRATVGDALLRVKGIVRVVGEPAPLVLHGVHHLFHPAMSAPGLDWPLGRSAIVFITKGLDGSALQQGFDGCVAPQVAAGSAGGQDVHPL